jgi:hypothetical protein
MVSREESKACLLLHKTSKEASNHMSVNQLDKTSKRLDLNEKIDIAEETKRTALPSKAVSFFFVWRRTLTRSNTKKNNEDT